MIEDITAWRSGAPIRLRTQEQPGFASTANTGRYCDSGKLRDLIWVDRNPNLLLAANQLGIAAIVFTAIFTSYDQFGLGLASTVLFGLLGIVVMGLAFYVLDWLTPGKLGEVIAASERHPAALVSAATHFGAAIIVCACIA